MLPLAFASKKVTESEPMLEIAIRSGSKRAPSLRSSVTDTTQLAAAAVGQPIHAPSLASEPGLATSVTLSPMATSALQVLSKHASEMPSAFSVPGMPVSETVSVVMRGASSTAASGMAFGMSSPTPWKFAAGRSRLSP